jgi:hypothetical protein
MTVNSETTSNGPFVPNGVATTFGFTFKVYSKADLRVIRLSPDGLEVLIDPALYDVAINAGDGGSVVFGVAPIAGSPIYIQLFPAYTQLTDIPDEGPFLPSVIGQAIDLLEMRINALRALVLRATLVPFGEAGFNWVSAALRAGKIPSFDVDGNLVFVSSNLKGDKGRQGRSRRPRAARSVGSGSGDVIAANNLSDIPTSPQARINLGLQIGCRCPSVRRRPCRHGRRSLHRPTASRWSLRQTTPRCEPCSTLKGA